MSNFNMSLNPVTIFAGLTVVKFGGYCAAAAVLRRVYPRSRVDPFTAGLTRTGTEVVLLGGYAAFAVVGSLVLQTTSRPGAANALLWLFFVGLVATRLTDWWFNIWLFYDHSFARPAKGWVCVLWGTIWSFALDFSLVALLYSPLGTIFFLL